MYENRTPSSHFLWELDGSVYSSSIIGSPLSRGEGKGASDLSFAFGNVTITTLPPFCYAMLSRFSRVRLCVTPEMAAHQAPPSLGFSRQEHWSGLSFSFPMRESEKRMWSHSVMSDSQRPHGLQPTRLLHPWDFPGKCTGVGCHCLLRPLEYLLSKTRK